MSMGFDEAIKLFCFNMGTQKTLKTNEAAITDTSRDNSACSYYFIRLTPIFV